MKPYRTLLSVWILLFVSFSVVAEEVWTEVKSPNFIVVSNAPLKQIKKAAKSFEQFRSLIKRTLDRIDVDPGAPLTIFAANDETAFRLLVGEEKREKRASEKLGIFVGGAERKFVALRVDLPQDQGYHVIYHEYVHMMTQLNYGELPLWLSEGLAEFFGFSSVADGRSMLGAPGPQSIQMLKTRRLLPLPQLFSVTRESPYYRDRDKTPVFYAQSWLLTHYLMIGDKRAHTKQLDAYLELLRKGIKSGEAAKQAFGDLKALELALQSYLRLSAFYTLQYAGGIDSLKEDSYKSRTLTASESLALRGELLVYVDKPDQARAALEKSLEIDRRNPRANEALGHFYLRRGDREQADRYFSAAAELDSNSYLAQFYAAHSKLEKMTADTFGSAETHLRKAIAINPRFAAAYRNLSYVLQKQAKYPEALAMAEKAVLLEPGVLSHQINVAQIMAAMGRIDEAQAMAQRALSFATTDEDCRQAESILGYIRSVRYSKPAAATQVPQPEMKVEQPEKQEEVEQLKTLNEMVRKQRAEARLRATVKTGPLVKLRGIVKSMRCDYPATLDLVIEDGGKERRVHAENYYQVQYGAIGGLGKDNFDPCTELAKRMVEVEMLRVSGQQFSGLVKSVTIIK